MTDLTVFNFKGNSVRTVRQNDEPWFCLSDVCKVLELSTPSRVKERLNAKGVSTTHTLTAGGKQHMLFINEQNLYKVIFQSRKKEAEAFTDWVTGEVLPAIRRTGQYGLSAKDRFLEKVYGMLADDPASVPANVVELAKQITAPAVSPSAPKMIAPPKISKTAQLSMVFRALPGINDFLDKYRDWTPRMDFVNAFYQQYADYVCGIDRCRWWDALQRIRPLERDRTTRLEYIRFR